MTEERSAVRRKSSPAAAVRSQTKIRYYECQYQLYLGRTDEYGNDKFTGSIRLLNSDGEGLIIKAYTVYEAFKQVEQQIEDITKCGLVLYSVGLIEIDEPDDGDDNQSSDGDVLLDGG